ncbi:MAG TPA: PIG-L family deacetylase [Jatrophihabitans sp.]|jgi:LmbE family N-acetylglucosaminyl deacetylase|uniref:PIG-L deacetylase family protein n=1 Tax=Jatrophihabitans sp. TaxID=1932789 RepID=UPI002E077980|nr:PIG-L family deacetylase [Jatrophihabitans sp.]
MRARTGGGLAAVLAAVLLLGGLSLGSGRAAGATGAPSVPAPRDHVVFFVPHADDDVLSMGVLMQSLVRAGKTVDVVYYTDGAGTKVCSVDFNGICRGSAPYYGWPVARFIAARDAELTGSVEALGITADHIHLYGPYGQRRRDGTVDAPYATAMLQYYYALPEFHDATFVTMSWLDDNPDHSSAGVALRALVAEGKFPAAQALFTLARWYWAYDYPQRALALSADAALLRVVRGYPIATELLRCPDQQCLDEIHSAVDSYKSPYGIGYSSVKTYLDVTDGDPELLLHGVQAGRYPTRATLPTGRRGWGATASTTMTGRVSLPAFGRYGTNPDDPANAADLAQSLQAGAVPNPFPRNAAITLRALSGSGSVLSSVRALLRSGSYTAQLSVPAGSVWVTATSDPTVGLSAAAARVPVAAQQVTPVRAPGLRVSGTAVTGGYGQSVSVQVRNTILGHPMPTSVTTLEQPSVRPIASRANALGIAVLRATITRSGIWRVMSSTPAGGLSALGTSVVIRVIPAALVVRPSAATVRLRYGAATLSGQLAGRGYPIVAAYLRPTRVTAWLHAPGRRAVWLGSTDSVQGGRFAMTVTAPTAGVVTYSIAPIRDVYAAVPATASVNLTY